MLGSSLIRAMLNKRMFWMSAYEGHRWQAYILRVLLIGDVVSKDGKDSNALRNRKLWRAVLSICTASLSWRARDSSVFSARRTKK